MSHFKECRIIIDNRGIYDMASGTCMKGQASSMISTFGSETKGWRKRRFRSATNRDVKDCKLVTVVNCSQLSAVVLFTIACYYLFVRSTECCHRETWIAPFQCTTPEQDQLHGCVSTCTTPWLWVNCGGLLLRRTIRAWHLAAWGEISAHEKLCDFSAIFWWLEVGKPQWVPMPITGIEQRPPANIWQLSDSTRKREPSGQEIRFSKNSLLSLPAGK